MPDYQALAAFFWEQNVRCGPEVWLLNYQVRNVLFQNAKRVGRSVGFKFELLTSDDILSSF